MVLRPWYKNCKAFSPIQNNTGLYPILKVSPLVGHQSFSKSLVLPSLSLTLQDDGSDYESDFKKILK